jgi:hypothetical protein
LSLCFDLFNLFGNDFTKPSTLVCVAFNAHWNKVINVKPLWIDGFWILMVQAENPCIDVATIPNEDETRLERSGTISWIGSINK